MKKYFILPIVKKTVVENLSDNHEAFLQSTQNVLNQICDYKIEGSGKISLSLKGGEYTTYSTLELAQEQLRKNTTEYQWIVEYNEDTQEIAAIHDPYFAKSDRIFYRVELNNLYLQTKHDASSEIDKSHFFNSVGFEILQDIAIHNTGKTKKHTRGLALTDLLLNNLPKESYTIIRNPREIKLDSSIPQVNFDRFDTNDIADALRFYGSFEIVGPSIDKLKSSAMNALNKCKELLALIPTLSETEKEAIYNQNFYGFQDVKKETQIRAKTEDGTTVRNQIAYYYKPYLPSRAPEGFEETAFREYYSHGMAMLQSLYRKIMLSFKVDPKRVSPVKDDKKSILATRRYFASKGEKGERTGIPAHSDYGRLTLVFSDQEGLEVKKRDESWIAAPAGSDLRFYINPGDWLRFQIADPTIMPGIHRVPEIAKGKPDRHSLALFLNPAEDESVRFSQDLTELSRDFDSKVVNFLLKFQSEEANKGLAMTYLDLEQMKAIGGNVNLPQKLKK